MHNFSDQEIERYHRQLILPEFGPEGQKRLMEGKVLVIGAGGLGCPILQYLVAVGVGTVGVVDHDAVSASNLHRQILYTSHDVGKSKAEVAVAKLALLNPLIKLNAYPIQLDRSNALELIKAYDIVIDGSDNFPTRYLVNDACVLCDKPLVYGSIYKFEGQVSIFNADLGNTRSANYRDLFPQPPAANSVPSCSEIGVLGVLAGIIGCLQANEAVKLLAGIGEPLIEKLFILDSLNFSSQNIKYKKTEQPKITELMDYELFCNSSPDSSAETESISPAALQRLITEEGAAFVVDVRQEIEHTFGKIPSVNIPLDRLAKSVETIPRDKKVVLYCKSGQRSAKGVTVLTEAGIESVAHLEGGLLAYRKMLDPGLKIL